ncbi:MAG: acyloxyacyl hydrolase [Maricaulaceae bacterium]
MKFTHITTLVGFLLMSTHVAQAQVSEVRVGANVHDIDWTGLGSGSDKERSWAINGEVVFDSPDFLNWAFSPQPYVGATLNLEGETSHGGAGLMWRFDFAKSIYFDFSFGLAVHDGTLETDPSDLVQSVIDDSNITDMFTQAQTAQFQVDLADFRNRQETQLDLGSRALFRQQIALGYRWSEDWSTHIFAEHLSNGKILVQNAPNEGLDTIGFRVARHF